MDQPTSAPKRRRSGHHSGGRSNRGASSDATRGAFSLGVLSDVNGAAVFHLRRQSSRRFTPVWRPNAEPVTDLDKRVRTIPNIVTAAPTPTAPIDPQLVAETEGLGHYADLFLRGVDATRPLLECVRRAGRRETAALSPVSEMRRVEAPRQRNSYVIPAHEYTQLAVAVFEAGHHFIIDAEGRPHVSVHGARVPTNMDIAAIRAGAERAGVTDLSALHSLEFGFSLKCDSTQPRDCIWVANTPAVLANASALNEIICSEQALDMVTQAQLLPPFCPISVRQLGLVEKGPQFVGGPMRYRNIGNHSFPPVTLEPARSSGSRMGARCETGAFLAPNANVHVDTFATYAWLDIYDVAISIDVVCGLGAAAGVGTRGGCYDFKSWFRQLPLCVEDKWLAVTTFAGRFITDNRMVMGASSSADAAMRTSNILLQIVLDDLDVSFEAVYANRRDGVWSAVSCWRQARLAACGGDVAQARAFWCNPYADDSPFVTIEPLVEWLDASVRGTLARLGVSLSGKELPPAILFDAIGGCFNLITRTVLPREFTRDKYRGFAAEALAADGRLFNVLDWIEPFVGLHEFVAGLQTGNGHRSNAGNMFKTSALRSGRLAVAITARFADDIRTVLAELEKPVPFSTSPLFYHGGDNVSGDASTKDGWGVHVGPFYAFARWDERTRLAVATLAAAERARSADSVSISPLELLTSAFLVVLLGLRGVGHFDAGTVRNFIGRSDNLSACNVVNTGRATSKTMFMAYEAFLAAQRDYGIRLRLEHISGAVNTIADRLSHGNVDEATRLLRLRGFNPVLVQLPAAFIGAWEVRVREAATATE
jgi:hypothetical protein